MTIFIFILLIAELIVLEYIRCDVKSNEAYTIKYKDNYKIQKTDNNDYILYIKVGTGFFFFPIYGIYKVVNWRTNTTPGTIVTFRTEEQARRAVVEGYNLYNALKNR